MAEFGITRAGFVVKPLARILQEKQERAREMFGQDVDLRSTSALRKLLDISSAGDLELWKLAERNFYGNFISTATGDSLDLLGEDLGVARRQQRSRGSVKLTLSGEAPGRTYNLPVRTVVETTAAPGPQFYTLALVSLSGGAKEAVVEIEARERGPVGDVADGAIDRINPQFAERFLRLGGATIDVTNEEATADGNQREPDTLYRDLLLGYPRTLWTLEAVRQAIKTVDSVRDCRLVDPAGGVDVSLSKFNLFNFSQRRFGSQRLFGSPYRFDVLIATQPGFVWESGAGVPGVREEVDEAIREVRPISIFPNIRRADHVQVGLRCNVLIAAGHDVDGVRTAITDALERRINTLGLGRNVLFSDVLADMKDVTSVIDVTQLRLRRCPPVINRINFGGSGRFRGEAVELPVGENLNLEPNEIAEFKIDSGLIGIEVTNR